MLKKIYIVVASLALVWYAADGMFGWEYGNPQRTMVPADQRRSPGWSHATGAHFWYLGYRGGK
jgi:hypothetical protein